jgi:DNA invertase Pin-like site-specific DNA recombinase
VIVVYRVDRLTCSLADFAKLVELVDTRVVSFASVTRSFHYYRHGTLDPQCAAALRPV